MHVLYGLHTVAWFSWDAGGDRPHRQLHQARPTSRRAVHRPPWLHDPHLLVDLLWLLLTSPLYLLFILPGIAALRRRVALVPVPLHARLAAVQRNRPTCSEHHQAMNHDPNCIFCKIAAGPDPLAQGVRGRRILAFHDIHPWAPVHFLMIPKRHIPSMAHVGRGGCRAAGPHDGAGAPKLAKQEGL
jgi:hypothetical protein